MYYSFKGKIVDIGKDWIAIEVGDVGYDLFVSHPDAFKVGEETEVYVYEVYNENDHYLAGFSSKMEKSAFLSLIDVKGIGPKTALNALKETTPEELFKAIEAGNTSYLKKLPGIGAKAASQIILDLKGKLFLTSEGPKQYADVAEALKKLGFKNKDIDLALSGINDSSLSSDEVLRRALQKLGRKS